MVYKWTYSMGIPAQVAGEEMERIEGKHGVLTPEILLEESRSKNAVLHRCFEWNDKIAAEKYRVKQAVQMIANITVVFDDEGKDIEPVRAFVNVSTERKGSFVNVYSAMQNKSCRDIVLKAAYAELVSFRKKYRNLSEFANLFAEIDKMVS